MSYLLSGALIVSLVGAILITKLAIDKEKNRNAMEHIGWTFWQFDEEDSIVAKRFYFAEELQPQYANGKNWYYDPFAHVDEPREHETYWKVRGVDWDNIILYDKIYKSQQTD